MEEIPEGTRQTLLTSFRRKALMKRQAEVAELADALGSGPSGTNYPVEVQVLSSVLTLQGVTSIRRNPFFIGRTRSSAILLL